MIEINVKQVVFGQNGITLWPFIFYTQRNRDKGIDVHEHFHWHQQLKWGILPWFIVYGIFMIIYAGKPVHRHPLERPAYIVEWKFRGYSDKQIQIMLQS